MILIKYFSSFSVLLNRWSAASDFRLLDKVSLLQIPKILPVVAALKRNLKTAKGTIYLNVLYKFLIFRFS